MAIKDQISNGHHAGEEEREQGPLRVDKKERAPARIKVIGVGGGGCNCVRRMLRPSVPGVTFAMVNTDINPDRGERDPWLGSRWRLQIWRPRR